MKNKKKYVISIDQGSTSTKSIIYDDKLNSIASSQTKLDEIYPKEGWVEIDPNQIIKSVLYTIKDVVEKSEIDKDKIISIGITNQRETIVFWDKSNLKPVGNAISWQCLRGKDICDKLRGSKFEKLLVDSTGLKLDPYFSFSKIVWSIKNNEKIYKLLTQNKLSFGTVDSWLIANMVEGSPHKIEITNASRTGLYNTKSEDWDKELLSFLEIDSSCLPEILSSNENFGNIKKEIIGKSLPINAILGDQQSSLYGHKEKEKLEIKCTFGTGGFLLIDTGKKRVESNINFLSTLAFKKKQNTNYALEGSILSAGSTIEWLKKIGIIENFDDIEKAIEFSKLNQVMVIPAINGLGAPFWNGNVRASLENLSSNTTREDIIRATFESIAFSTKAIIEIIERTVDIDIDEMKIDGGISRSKFFSQFLADLINKKIKVAANSEITSLGVAKLSLESSQVIKSNSNSYIDFNPNKNNLEIYNNKYEKWKKIILEKTKES